MKTRKTIITALRIVLVPLAIWLSYTEMLAFGILFHGRIDSLALQVILLEVFIIAALTAADFILCWRLRKKEGHENVARFFVVSSGIFAGFTLIPFLIVCFMGGFAALCLSIVPIVSVIILLSDFLYWLKSSVPLIKKNSC